MVDTQNSITQGPIWRPLLALFFPLWFGTFFQQLYNAVDALVVGRLVGTDALAAVGCTGPVANLTVGLFTGLASGAVVAIAQRFGAGRRQEVHQAVHTAMLLSLIMGAVLTVAGVLCAGPALRAMNTTAEAIDDATLYLRVFFLGMIPNVVYNMGTGVLRAIGDSRRPLYFLIAASVCNIVLDVLLVAVFHMGVAGAAIATVVSQLLSAVLVVRSLMRSEGEAYQFFPRQMRIDIPALRAVLLIGVPSALQSLMYSTSNIMIQAAINSFGTDTMAAWTAYGKVDVVFWMSLNSMGLALTTFAGQNFGAGKYQRLRRGVAVALGMTAGFTVALSALLVIFARPILQVFITKDTVLEIGVDMLRFLAPCYITYILIELLAGALRSAGKSFGPTLITVFGVCGLRLIWLFTAVPARHTVETVILSYPITWTIASAAMVLYYFKAKWLPENNVLRTPPSEAS